MGETAPFCTLPPELFPNIARHLPLLAKPPTLRALALTTNRLYHIIYPLLYSCLILKNEDQARAVIQRILFTEPQLGQIVKELHIMSDLSIATRKEETPFDVVTGLKNLIEIGLLPQVHTLTLHLLRGWHEDRNYFPVNRFGLDYYPVKGFGHLERNFFMNLRTKCPHLRRLDITGLGDSDDDPWLEESGIFEWNEFKGLTTMRLAFREGSPSHDGVIKLMRNVAHVAPSIQTLKLSFKNIYQGFHPSHLLQLHFPYLRSLVLEFFLFNDNDLQYAMSFWYRHSTIEHLELQVHECRPAQHWFSDDVGPELLPNLKYLKANYVNVRALAPILHQLINLSIYYSINAQIPFLLRSILPDGLPGLKKLEIEPIGCSKRVIQNIEGAMWYETADGQFCQARTLEKAYTRFNTNYMLSIARGAPNLEELALQGPELHPRALSSFDLAQFARLERLYYKVDRGPYYPLSRRREFSPRSDFVASSRIIAGKCARLTAITDIGAPELPYITARIQRGGIEDVVVGEGYGMQLGPEDIPFPQNMTLLVSRRPSWP